MFEKGAFVCVKNFNIIVPYTFILTGREKFGIKWQKTYPEFHHLLIFPELEFTFV